MSESYDTQTSVQYGQELPYYINGFGISNDATTPNTILDISPGSCLDVTGTFQVNSNAVIKINAAVNGLNGLDTGTFAEATLYAVYLVWDPVTLQPTGAMISLNQTTPLLPFGYSAYLLIGYAATISNAAHFLPGYWSAGNSTLRTFTYDAFQETAVTAGASTSYAHVNLIAFVPNVNNTPVSIYTNFSANGAGDTLSMQSGNGTGDQVIITGSVVAGTAHTTSLNTVLAQPVSLTGVISPVINYKVSSGSDAVSIWVAGYTWYV
ncbi:MAG TPA: hypothetical protein VFE53_06480 [Mucilaginibacter sp.]|jgi:hypothetical protein|nr:hypothetical protein [Mucilaginibacter sp.]